MWFLNWVKAKPKTALTAASVIVGGIGTATGYLPLKAVSDTLAALAPILGG